MGVFWVCGSDWYRYQLQVKLKFVLKFVFHSQTDTNTGNRNRNSDKIRDDHRNQTESLFEDILTSRGRCFTLSFYRQNNMELMFTLRSFIREDLRRRIYLHLDL
ncbi:Hypothetical predicted protein [Xyrichtys novacula]|uniref:Uncharacterized protein n=1 Tax=Xyrichtys novacula TaxID=13765 RepID=A0AAV1FEE2_XYRNO|nr:Hypothetical predicted protein [Xyrichtys novacula]